MSKRQNKIKKMLSNQILRDVNIFKCSTGELNLGTRSVQDKTLYTRKEKHKIKEIYE